MSKINEEMTDVDLDQAGYSCPAKTNKIALIDADTVIYASCSVLEINDELLPRHMYTDTEWKLIEEDPGYDADLNMVRHINVEEAYEHSLDKIQSIMDRTGCIDFELHFTRGRESFPYTMVSADYKANRKLDDPLKVPRTLGSMKDYWVSKHSDKVFNNYKWEADHIVVCLKRDNPDKYELCAVDKDVYLALAGRHFNYYNSTKYKIPMKWVENTEDDAMRRFYIQTLTGDTGDGVIGLHGIGPVKAKKALAHCTNPRECWEAVVKMYEANGRDVIDAITNMRLVDMRQLEMDHFGDYQVKLWSPKDL